MYDKSKFSFLLAVGRQLEQALEQADRVGELADFLDDLGLLLAAVLERVSMPDGEVPGPDDDGIEDEDLDGDDASLGDSLEVGPDSRGAPSDVVFAKRRVGGARAAPAQRRLVVGGKRRDAALLKKGKRRGKK